MSRQICQLVLSWYVAGAVVSAAGGLQSEPVSVGAAAVDEVAAGWQFDAMADGFSSSQGGLQLVDVKGTPGLQSAGPRPPEFLGFSAENRGLQLDGRSWLQFADDVDGRLSFESGSVISLEAWVQTSSLKDGQQVYLIGKGRTGRAGMKKENQSWALRLRGMGGTARVSFLFRSADIPAGTDAGGQVATVAGELHRWNSNAGFAVDGEWHHVALSFRFGSTEAPVAWIDGEPTDGARRSTRC